MRIKLDELSKKVSEETGLNEYTVREINRSQWKMLHETMQSGTLKGVKITYIGKFSKKAYGYRKWKEAIKQSEERKRNI